MKGKVFLVGAGPGDPGLLTLRGRNLIQKADVVVYDRLVSDEVMEMIPARTQRIDVGKDAGNHPVPQHVINEILVEQARAGKQVIRLKGGDPLVFARGGEEMEALDEAGIAFEVVPGISSAIAAPVYGGVPLTHRDYCSSLHIITGHQRGGKELGLDFEALTRLGGTLVFLMSVANIGEIAQGLLDAGMDPQTPCAAVERGTTSRQRRIMATLHEIEAAVREKAVRSPAVIVVGRVCTLADRFAWFEKKPLLGKRILVTQPARRASRMADGLRELGAEVVLYPCIETTPIRPLVIPAGVTNRIEGGGEAAKSAPNSGMPGSGTVQLDVTMQSDRVPAAAPASGFAEVGRTSADQPFDTLVFTSAEGVHSYCDWILEQGQDMRVLAGCRIACIGSATASALRDYGLRADFIPSTYSGQVLGREMVERGFVNRRSRVLLLRTQLASRDVTDALAAAGIPFADVPMYETRLLTQRPLAELEADRPFDLITFTSRSCVEGFLRSQQAAAAKEQMDAGSQEADVTELAGAKAEGCSGGQDRAEPAFAGRRALCIGAQTAAAAAGCGFEVILSAQATIESMLEAAREWAGGIDDDRNVACEKKQ